MLLAGALVVVLGAFNLLTFMPRIFTPMVTTVFLFLLTFQLSLIFFEGMLKFTEQGHLDLPVSLFSLGVAALVMLLKIKGRGSIANFSILIGLVIGWGLYMLLFPTEKLVPGTAAAWTIPVFPFGAPNWHSGIVLVTFLASLVILSNTVAAVQAAGSLLCREVTESRFRNSYLLSGMYSIGGSVLGLVAYAPFASAVGFLESTQITGRKPFLIGGGLLALLGLIPFVNGILAAMPITVGNAVLFAAYMQLFGTSLKSLNGRSFDSVTIHHLAVPVLSGLGILFIDPKTFADVPALLQPLVTNGFIVGVLLSVVLEKAVKWERR
jgi:xanthine/uracil permease